MICYICAILDIICCIVDVTFNEVLLPSASLSSDVVLSLSASLPRDVVLSLSASLPRVVVLSLSASLPRVVVLSLSASLPRDVILFLPAISFALRLIILKQRQYYNLIVSLPKYLHFYNSCKSKFIAQDN